jgi:hypothetical protein
MTRVMRVGQIVCGGLVALAGMQIGERYIGRLPFHDGYFLVAVDDAVTSAPARPRRTLVVVADGLGGAFARGTNAAARLQAAGQCRVTDVGPISVSRPVYAVISTGLEQDRTGARNNDQATPLAAESIWEVARGAGLTVVGVSDVPWWQQLFPGGFDRYAARPEEEDYFATTQLGDLTLIHASYVDHVGHASGAASLAYAAAVERLDGELGAQLDRMDLRQDLVVLTADHGHSPGGGHGGRAPEIARVWTCFAGPGVAPLGEAGEIHSHAIAGSLAVLLGLRFPRHMRAGEDDLDAMFEIAGAMPPAYLDERRAGVARVREANATALAGWLGGPGTWTDLYTREGRKQWLRAAGVALVVLAGFVAAARRRGLGVGGTLRLAGWCAAIVAASVALHVIVLGSFDWTAINLRERYLRAAPLICLAPAVLAIGWHRWRRRDASLAADLLTVAALGLAINLGHMFVFGWPLGFPLPSPAMLLLPFFASFFMVVHGLLATLAAGVALLRAKPVVVPPVGG